MCAMSLWDDGTVSDVMSPWDGGTIWCVKALWNVGTIWCAKSLWSGGTVWCAKSLWDDGTVWHAMSLYGIVVLFDARSHWGLAALAMSIWYGGTISYAMLLHNGGDDGYGMRFHLQLIGGMGLSNSRSNMMTWSLLKIDWHIWGLDRITCRWAIEILWTHKLQCIKEETSPTMRIIPRGCKDDEKDSFIMFFTAVEGSQCADASCHGGMVVYCFAVVMMKN